MRKAEIFFKDELAGTLTQHDDGSYSFQYNQMWILDSKKPPISLTFPKKDQIFHSKYFFPFFFNMLPEGTNIEAVCHYHRLDLDDYFSILVSIAKGDNIGAISVKKRD